MEQIDLTDHKGAEAQVQAIVAGAKSPEEAKQLLQQRQYHPAAEVYSVQHRSDCWEVLILLLPGKAPRTIRCEIPAGYDDLLGTVVEQGVRMQGKRFSFLNDAQHSGYNSDYFYSVCVDERVHVRWREYARSALDKVTTSISEIKRCNGSCKHPIIDLPPKVEKAVAEWLEPANRQRQPGLTQ